MTIKTNGKKRELVFGDFIVAAYAPVAHAVRKDLFGWLSTNTWLCFEAGSAL
jgi:hypothetical protein